MGNQRGTEGKNKISSVSEERRQQNSWLGSLRTWSWSTSQQRSPKLLFWQQVVSEGTSLELPQDLNTVWDQHQEQCTEGGEKINQTTFPASLVFLYFFLEQIFGVNNVVENKIVCDRSQAKSDKTIHFCRYFLILWMYLKRCNRLPVSESRCFWLSVVQRYGLIKIITENKISRRHRRHFWSWTFTCYYYSKCGCCILRRSDTIQVGTRKENKSASDLGLTYTYSRNWAVADMETNSTKSKDLLLITTWKCVMVKCKTWGWWWKKQFYRNWKEHQALILTWFVF